MLGLLITVAVLAAIVISSNNAGATDGRTIRCCRYVYVGAQGGPNGYKYICQDIPVGTGPAGDSCLASQALFDNPR
jgi:hypothetical protein